MNSMAPISTPRVGWPMMRRAGSRSISRASTIFWAFPPEKFAVFSLGSRGRIFVLGLLVAFIELALVGITQSFFIFLAFKNHFVLPTWAAVAQQFVAFATTTFIAPMFSTGLTLFYYDQRVRKEGYDIEWMMQAAGMNVSLETAAAPLQPPASAASVEGIAEILQAKTNGAEQQTHGEQP